MILPGIEPGPLENTLAIIQQKRKCETEGKRERERGGGRRENLSKKSIVESNHLVEGNGADRDNGVGS